MEETEIRVNSLQAELNGLRNTRDKTFRTPPVEWIEAKLEKIKALLEKNLAHSSEALWQLLGPVTLQAVYPDIGKPYYVAHSSIDTFALLEYPPSDIGAEKGSTTLRWWTWSQRIRTKSILNFEFILLDTATPPLYQEISAKSVQLHQLGLSKKSIATKLKVDEKTVSKAIRWTKQD